MQLVYRIVYWVQCPACKRKSALRFLGDNIPTDIVDALLQNGWKTDPTSGRIGFCPKCVEHTEVKSTE